MVYMDIPYAMHLSTYVGESQNKSNTNSKNDWVIIQMRGCTKKSGVRRKNRLRTTVLACFLYIVNVEQALLWN